MTRLAAHEIVTTGLEVPEGPVILPGGDVLVVEIKGGRLTRVDPAGEKSVVAVLGGGPNGAALGPDGRVYVCNNGGCAWHHVEGDLFLPLPRDTANAANGYLQAVDLATGEVDCLVEEWNGHRLHSPNDLVFDGDGGCYFTDFGRSFVEGTEVGHVYYADPGFERVRRVISGLNRPNGCGLSPAGDRFYVSETTTARVWWWRVEAPGVLTGGSTFRGSGGGNLLYGAPGYDLFDSLAVDERGNVCVATYFDRGLTVISPSGELVEVVGVDDRLITNVAFGGSGASVAYLTAVGSGALLALPWPRPELGPAWADQRVQ